MGEAVLATNGVLLHAAAVVSASRRYIDVSFTSCPVLEEFTLGTAATVVAEKRALFQDISSAQYLST